MLAATQPKVAGPGGSGALFDVSAPSISGVPAPVHSGASASVARTSPKSGSVGLLTLVAVLGVIMLALAACGTTTPSTTSTTAPQSYDKPIPQNAYIISNGDQFEVYLKGASAKGTAHLTG